MCKGVPERDVLDVAVAVSMALASRPNDLGRCDEEVMLDEVARWVSGGGKGLNQIKGCSITLRGKGVDESG